MSVPRTAHNQLLALVCMCATIQAPLWSAFILKDEYLIGASMLILVVGTIVSVAILCPWRSGRRGAVLTIVMCVVSTAVAIVCNGEGSAIDKRHRQRLERALVNLSKDIEGFRRTRGRLPSADDALVAWTCVSGEPSLKYCDLRYERDGDDDYLIIAPLGAFSDEVLQYSSRTRAVTIIP